MRVLSFMVLGQPAPQGSVRAFVQGGRAIVTSANVKLRPWRDTVTWAARDALGLHTERPTFPIAGPVDLTVEFWLHRPKNRPKTIDVLPLVPPDLDKLVRAVGDSLVNAGVIADDSLVTDLSVSKRYAVSPDLSKIYVPGYHRHEPCAVVLIRERPAPTERKTP
jgi:Holliday junction resolvase RusA-like endonuclease